MVSTIRRGQETGFPLQGWPSCRPGRRPFLAIERTKTSGKQRRASPADARDRGSIWSVSDSFPELVQAVTELAQPSRIDIVRAKRHLLAQISDGLPHPVEALITSVAHLLGAEPLGYPQIDLPARDSVKTVVTSGHPVPASIRADLTAREALAELGADGMLIPAGPALFRGSAEITLTCRQRRHRPHAASAAAGQHPPHPRGRPGGGADR